MTRLSRRDFLKLAGTLSASAYLSNSSPTSRTENQPNVLILLFDTMSARHLSLHGYPRQTSPNLERFAERATVYHSHYAAGNYTTPSTASMLLGIYPWKHRAHTHGGIVRRDLVNQNLFALFGNDFHRLTFAQTWYANILMQQFFRSVDRNLPSTSFSLSGRRLFFNDHFLRETALTNFLFEDFAVHLIPDLPGTLVGGYLSSGYFLRHGDYFRTGFPDYPLGIPYNPNTNLAFLIEDVFGGVFEAIRDSSAQPLPHLSYHHLFAPHEPSKPRQEFLEMFKDDYEPVRKPDHPLGEGRKFRELVKLSDQYDSYMANVDYEFGLLMDKLEQEGLLENTYVIVTSDHGQLFERSTFGHAGPLMYDSVLHIPLLIRAPGQTSRVDVHTQTSNIDVLPTLLSLLGKDVPTGLDGRLLPGYGGEEDPSRAIYSMVSERVSSFGPLHEGTFVLQQLPYKLIFNRGNEKYKDVFELYNLQEDPDELVDLISKETTVAKQMKDQLLDALQTADEPYE
jgi:arylsulfatase A-like enzyme